ncbi:EAL domain-containing protein [Hydrogenovibrio sp. 3SP14C1]|uniref:EAL domain-containing protein n=1 Tax=Hydrogenovibrio sp. 3SP14C1 TaxID=3038774 RepID=UPI002416EFB3|nr:EAL domain-containing protein [Hydrogenovibrio sp. 3SP14C1]MDG4812341.1 EAL domain-containing protein [Hydrogenovibrio sp. 3SP14C1]
MHKNSNTFINYLVIGYSFVIILVTISASIFFNYEQKISQAFQTYSENNAFQNNIDALFNSATQRSILMVRMINTEDIFEIDDLHLQMFGYEQNVIQNLIALRKNTTREDQKALLAEAGQVMTKNRTFQESVYSLLMENKKQEALNQLVDVTLPLQKQVISILNQLKKGYEAEIQRSQKRFAYLISEMRTLILLVAIPILLSIFVIAMLSIRRLKRFANTQQGLLDNLEDRVNKRTHELLLDRNLMQNLNEAIGVFDENDQLHISNKKLTELRLSNNLDNSHSVWELLSKAFLDLDILDIQQQLATQGAWRGEAALTNHTQQYLIIDIAKVQDSSLPSIYYSIILTDITELKGIQKQLEFTANYDVVTQLPNRYSFNYEIYNLIQKSPSDPFHLFYLDLNDFKWVNDHLGHAAGDEFLWEAGVAFKQVLPPGHFISRLGGDEFAIIIQQPMQPIELTQLANQLLLKLRKVNQKQKTGHEVGCSIGISSYPEHGNTAETLLKHADYAMYCAKKEGDSPYYLFSHEMNEQLLYLHEIEESLHIAVREKQFQVHYQPQYSLHTLELVGAEALVRWPRKNRMVPPGEFIPLAEKFGLINQIGEFVFETAVKQINQWGKCKIALPRVAINTSSTQLLTGNFGAFVEQTIAENQLSADRIDIEVTESVMMKNIEHNGADANDTSCLSILQEKGLEISIDDFGTGYSSLSYIKHLNVDRIKIDKSFIDDIEFKSEARSIVKAIINMGHSLGLKVLAEGIETPNQLDILKSLNCDEGQGFLFSKPLEAEKFEMKCLS